MKECNKCVYDKDIISMVNGCKHKWHNDEWDDMCCLCGIDYEYLFK